MQDTCRRATMTPWLILSCLAVPAALAANEIKGLDDSILFRLNWAGTGTNLLESPDYEKLLMTTTNNEKYECLVPISYGIEEDGLDSYKGQNALNLLMPLFKKQNCNLRLESYWTYELCHGMHIKQYHEEREGKSARLHEYSLGETSMEALEQHLTILVESLKVNPKPNIPTTKIEGINMPYFVVNYTDGTLCDLTGKPRSSHVLFVCYEDGRHDIYSIKEIYTCEYEIVILSPLLCEHPAYRPRDLPQTDLHCVPFEGNPVRPRNLLQAEAESLKLRSHGTVLGGDTSTGSVKLKVLQDNQDKVVVDDEEGEAADDTTPEATPSAPKVKLNLFPPQPSIDQKLVEDFLNGDYCLHGGSGWWKYEFCYGRKVEQYHEGKDGSRTVILLGEFNVNDHLEWITKHPEKRYKSGKRHVAHFYTGGSICDLTGQPRTVEVKLKCKETSSPSSVALYLLEPVTCQYTLGVETSIVCPLLETADENGLFSKPSTVKG
ncbi:unnamed protein product, partial [Meganyctiphanes norvegica]